MRLLRYLFLVLGLALLGGIVVATDFTGALELVRRTGGGLLLVLAVYIVGFAGDVFGWLLTLPTLPIRAGWYWRLWLIRMIGEAFNYTLPAGGMGGEPVKAVLLNRHFGIAYRDGAASLFLIKTVNLIALVAFLGAGFAFMGDSAALSGRFRTVAGVGLAGLAAGITGFFLVQRYGVSSAVVGRLPAWAGGERLVSAVSVVRDVEARFVGFYAARRLRFCGALATALVVWIVGAVEIHVTLALLGQPVSFRDAWIIEAAAQLVRAGTFFIPASLGAQEGAFLVVCGAITGSPTVALAVALVRRLREIVWFGSGFAAGFLMGGAARRVPD